MTGKRIPFRLGSLADLRRLDRGVVREHARPCTTCRAPWATGATGRRTPQHARHRERGHLGRDRPCRRAGTRTIRVGAGGIMLPNHAPLVVAEQFGTLATLYPDRIDPASAARRAPTSARWSRCAAISPATSIASRRTCSNCRRISPRPNPASRPCAQFRAKARRCRSGSSDRACSRRAARRRARTAVRVRLAFRAGRTRQCTRTLPAPFQAVGHPCAAVRDGRSSTCSPRDSDAEARRLFTSLQQAFLNLRRGTPGQLPSCRSTSARSPRPRNWRCSNTRCPARSSAPRIWCARASPIFCAHAGGRGHRHRDDPRDHAARLRSFEILAETAIA